MRLEVVEVGVAEVGEVGGAREALAEPLVLMSSPAPALKPRE